MRLCLIIAIACCYLASINGLYDLALAILAFSVVCLVAVLMAEALGWHDDEDGVE